MWHLFYWGRNGVPQFESFYRAPTFFDISIDRPTRQFCLDSLHNLRHVIYIESVVEVGYSWWVQYQVFPGRAN